MFIIRLEHFKKYEYMATTIFMVKIKWCDSDYQTVLIQWKDFQGVFFLQMWLMVKILGCVIVEWLLLLISGLYVDILNISINMKIFKFYCWNHFGQLVVTSCEYCQVHLP